MYNRLHDSCSKEYQLWQSYEQRADHSYAQARAIIQELDAMDIESKFGIPGLPTDLEEIIFRPFVQYFFGYAGQLMAWGLYYETRSKQAYQLYDRCMQKEEAALTTAVLEACVRGMDVYCFPGKPAECMDIREFCVNHFL